MPKPILQEPYNTLAYELVETMLAGHHEWRYDLTYPESHSDLMGCALGVLKMFEVKRRPLALDLTKYYK